MALSLVNNITSLNAQTSLSKTNSSLSKSLERLSTGLKVNRGADGPAALVISEKMRAQVSGLKTALDNTNKAVSLVQTGEGALNEVNSLLNKARSLVLDSANNGVNDAKSFAANQAELDNILGSIDNIANRTDFNGTKLLNSNQTLTFQTGANSGETASLSITDSQTTAIGSVTGAAGARTLADLKSTSGTFVDMSIVGAGGATAIATDDSGAVLALGIVDKAISDVTSQRGAMGAFQANNLESNANTLRNSLENTTAAESVIRDTDFASEIANFTKLQTQMQAGSTVLGNANQMTSLVAQLLRG